MGRHSAPDGDDVVESGSVVRRDSGTHADLEMLRDNPALRARCLAAAVVPFVLYTVILIVVGHAGVFVLWVWVPIVTAGILVGAMLDLGHRDAGHRTHTTKPG
jgi:hypothetical protein